MKPRLVVVCLLWLVFGCSRQSPSVAVEFQTKKECAERAEAYLRRERSIDTPANGINAFIKNEQYKYNRSLNTCLLYFEEVEIDSGTTYNIIDTLTSRKIYYYVSLKDPSAQQSFDALCKSSEGCLSQADFKKKRAELFDGSD